MKQKYPSSLRFFYLVVKNILDLLKNNNNNFNQYKALYTSAYADNLLTQLAAAIALPSIQGTIAERKLARANLMASAKAVRHTWQALKGYIEQAFPAAQVNTLLEEAGWIYFMDKAENWGSVNLLGVEGGKFILKYEAELKANNNMATTFPAEFEAIKEKFEVALTTFNNATTGKMNAKKAKIMANNALYAAVVSISKDAAIVYNGNEETRQQYAFTFQLALLKGGSASFKGYVTDGQGLPVEGVSVGSTEGKYDTVTDAKGYFKITKMEHGDYQFVFAKTGMVTVHEFVTLKAGSSKTLRIEMQAQVQMQAA